MSLPGLFLKLSLEEPTAVKASDTKPVAQQQFQGKARNKKGAPFQKARQDAVARRNYESKLAEALASLAKEDKATREAKAAARAEAATKEADQRKKHITAVKENAEWEAKRQKYADYLEYKQLDAEFIEMLKKQEQLPLLQQRQRDIVQQRNALKEQNRKSGLLPSAKQEIGALKAEFQEYEGLITDIRNAIKSFPKQRYEGLHDSFGKTQKPPEPPEPDANPPHPAEYEELLKQRAEDEELEKDLEAALRDSA